MKRKPGEVLKEYVDPAATLIVAAVFAVLGATEVLGPKALAALTLAVLAAVAAVLLRQRYIMEEAQRILRELPPSFKELTKTVGAVGSDSDYEVVSNENIWDITAQDGSLAIGTKKKRLRFLRDNVATIYELTRAQGGQAPRVDGWDFRPKSLRKVGEFSSAGNQYILISLGRLYGRNQELDYEASRNIHGLFTDPQNSATIRADEGYDTHQMTSTVIWPKGRDPERVVVEEIGTTGTTTRELTAGDLQRTPEGRALLMSGPLRDPPRGTRIVVTWYW